MRSLLTGLLIFLVLASTVMAADYLPLSEGNQWNYSMSNGMKMIMKVAGFADVEGVRCAIIETDTGMQKSREYMALDSQGLKAYMAETQGQKFPYDEPVLRIKLPFVQGQTWTASMNQFGVSLVTTFQSLGTQPVETPLGSFECIVVRSSIEIPGQGSVVSDSYYADGKGLVRQKIKMAAGELVSTLTSTNLQPVEPAAPHPTPVGPSQMLCPKCKAVIDANTRFCPECGTKITPPAAPTVCPKCNAKLPPGAKFCPACGEKIVASISMPRSQPNDPNQPTLEKYQSQNGKLLLYKPEGWSVNEEDVGEGAYAVYIMEPQEKAAVIFMTFPVSEAIIDSVSLAAVCSKAIREELPTFKASSIKSTPQKDRTVAELTFTDEGEKGIGHGYFLYTKRVGTVYLLLASEDMWNQLRPMMTNVASNIAYAPEGVMAVAKRGQDLAAQTSLPQGRTLSPAAMIQQASQRPGKQIPLHPAALPDRSLMLQIPQGWSLEGQSLKYLLVDNPQTRSRGMNSISHTIIPSQMSVPGVINSPYQPPPQALSLVLQFSRLGTNLEILGQLPGEQAEPAIAQAVQRLRAQGLQVDSRLIHAKFKSVPTGITMRGLFSVQCTTMPMTMVWQISVDGSWAPDNEFDDWLPLYLRIGKTFQTNQQWVQADMQNRHNTQQQLNRNLQNSIAGAGQAFDQYMDSLQNADRSRDYIGWMQSQTTLGQGTWVAEYEGGHVYQTDYWGIEGPEGRIDSPAYNTTHFTGENPWNPGQLDLVDTRAEYEQYITAIK